MKFLFEFSEKGVSVSVKGKYSLEELRQTGANMYRVVPTGNYTTNRNGRRVAVTVGKEFVTTSVGEFELSKWHRLLEEAVFCEEQTGLLKVLMNHVREHCAWLHTNEEVRHYALRCLSSGAYHSWKI